MSGLRLFATDSEDLSVLSTLIQDAIMAAGDARYDAGRREVAMLMSRFRWEADGAPTRVRSCLLARGVLGAARARWPQDGTPLVVLAVTGEEGRVRIDFAGGAAVRLRTECLDLTLEDLGEPWAVRHRPAHRA